MSSALVYIPWTTEIHKINFDSVDKTDISKRSCMIAHDITLTSIQRFLNVMDVKTTLRALLGIRSLLIEF